MKPPPKFQLGQKIYHVLADEESAGMVTGILHRPDNYIYYVTWSDKTETQHLDIELSEEKVRNFAD